MQITEEELNEILAELRREEQLILRIKRRKRRATAVKVIERQTEYETARQEAQDRPEIYYHWQEMEKGLEIIKNRNGKYSIQAWNMIPRRKMKLSETETKAITNRNAKYEDHGKLSEAIKSYKQTIYDEINEEVLPF